MTAEIIRCRHCEQALIRVGKFWVCPQHGQVSLQKQSDTLRIFFSYAHDANEELVKRIKIDLEKRGHDVWFDKSDIKFGDDWRRSITEAITNSHKFVAFLSKHSIRDPGVCRDEIGIAIGVNEGNIQTILVESEQEVQPTPGISATQWLDMHEWRERRAASDAVWENWYQEKLTEIVRVVESDESRRFAGEIETLKHHLKPIRSDSRIYELLKKGLTGRRWLFDAVERWRSSDRASRVFWLMGAPGVGKSAIAAHLAIHGPEVLAVEFCNWQQPGHKNPEQIVRTIAFQIATRLADYRKLLLSLPQIAELHRKNYAELFDYILVEPLHHAIDGGRERHLIVIDALDEANQAGSNPLVEMLAHYAYRLPNWIGLVLTSRPESDVIAPLQALNPVRFEASSEKNLADIRDYLRHELASELNSRPNADRLLERILENSEGLFLYVERFCEGIRFGHFSLDSPEQFPQGLGGIFFQYFRRQFPNLKQYEKTIEPALGAILASRERLPVRTLQKLFKLRETQVRKWLRTFGSLFPVTKDSDNDVITPYHRSLADWMADASSAGVYFVSVGEGHQLFVEQLLRERGRESQLCLRNLPYHLVGAGRREDAQALLSDETWIEKKFFALGFEAILSDVDLIVQSALEQEDWPSGLGAAVAGATAVEHAFQVPPEEIIPIYARAGAGRHAVEMAQYIEGEYERAYLLTEIANAAEESDPELARSIRWQLWSSCKCQSSTDQVIVSRLAYADPQQLASFLQQCETDLHRAIVGYILKDENTLHRLVDLPMSDVASICAHLASVSKLTENEELFIAGFDPDRHRADSRLGLPIALSLLEIRKLAAQQSVKQAEAIARAMISVALGSSSYIQLFIRAILNISPADTLLGAKERPDPEERIRLLVEVSIAQVHRNDYDGALTAILEAVRLDEQNKHRYFRNGVYPSGARWVAVQIIRGIARTDPRRALELAKQSGLQRLTDTYLKEVVLWQLSNYKEVKKVARYLNLHEWRYAYALRAKHDLAGAYAAWKEKDGDVDELKTMLNHARAGEGALILKLLREEVLPKVYPAQEPADTTALKVEIARAVFSVNPETAKRVRNTIQFDRYHQSRINQVCLLPAFALAGDPEGALSLAWHLDKDDVGFGAVAMSEIARLSASGVIKFEDDLSLRSWFRSALNDIRKSTLTSENVNVIFTWPWAWANARVAGSIARGLTPRRMKGHFDWRPEQTLAVVVGKASAFWPEIREELNQDWIKSENRELVLCEASQWMPIDEWPMLEDIETPALAAIAWGRMARRTSSTREREEWNGRVREACESWPDPEDGQGLDVLWVFTDEMGTRNKLSRSLAARILDRCQKESFDFAPSLLAVAATGAFNQEQRQRITNLAFEWRDFLHTLQFANNAPYNDAQWLAAKHLLRLADVWWKTDLTNARVCLDLAVEHAREMDADPRRSRLQTHCLRSWAICGEAEDWKRALAHWRWGAPFLKAADAFVARWSAGGDPGYPEIQRRAIEWGQAVAEQLLKVR